MASSAECARAIAEHVSISRQIQSVVSATADLLQMPHFLSILGSLGCIMHQVLLSLQLLPLAFGILCILLLVLKREHLLRLVFVLLHLLLVQDFLLLLIMESLLFLVSIHVSINIVLL